MPEELDGWRNYDKAGAQNSIAGIGIDRKQNWVWWKSKEEEEQDQKNYLEE